jgi:hypothetical protein
MSIRYLNHNLCYITYHNKYLLSKMHSCCCFFNEPLRIDNFLHFVVIHIFYLI